MTEDEEPTGDAAEGQDGASIVFDSAASATEKVKTFIVSGKLYDAVTCLVAAKVTSPKFPASIERSCECSENPTTTWRFQHRLRQEYGKEYFVHDPEPRSGSGELVYRCANCDNATLWLWVWRTESTVAGGNEFEFLKIGQWPPPFEPVPQALSKVLDKEARDLYQHGLECLAFGLGIGANAYFRRVVEMTVNDMLDLAVRAASDEEREVFAAKVGEAKNSRSAADKLEIVKDFAPASLRMGGNPFATLYGVTSSALHDEGLSDEGCMGLANKLRSALEYVHVQIRRHLEESERFRSVIGELSTVASKKAKKG